MKCLDCGTEMEHGSVEGIGQTGRERWERGAPSTQYLRLTRFRLGFLMKRDEFFRGTH